MRVLLKLLGVIPLLILYVLCACAIALLPTSAGLRRAFLIKNTSFASRLMLGILGIRVQVNCRERLHESRRGRLIVVNHVSYIDVLVLASLIPSVFVTSVELGSTLFLGMLARLGGSMFVERRKATGLKREIAMIARVLGEGFPVVLFPEGTTSNGERVRPFKNSFFDAAVAAGTDILPICLHYTRVNGKRITSLNRDSVFYYGGTTFFQHVPRLLSLTSADVDVRPLKLIRVRDNASRKELAAKAHDAIRAAYHG